MTVTEWPESGPVKVLVCVGGGSHPKGFREVLVQWQEGLCPGIGYQSLTGRQKLLMGTVGPRERRKDIPTGKGTVEATGDLLLQRPIP